MSGDSLETVADELTDPIPESARSRSVSIPSWWKRAAGGVLGGALATLGLRRRSVGGLAVAVAGGWIAYRSVRSRSGATTDLETVSASVTIGKPADELSELARDAESLGRLVAPVADITALEEDRYRWTVRERSDRRLSWETRLVENSPGERLRWKPVDGPAVIDDWSMTFRPAPGDRGTEVTLEVRFAPSGGIYGSRVIDALDIVPETFVNVVLDRFKSLAETGEIPTTAGNPSARGRGDLL